MTLGEWLKKEGRMQSWVAEQLSVTEATVSHWVSGRRTPSQKKQESIAVLTVGAVMPMEWGERNG